MTAKVSLTVALSSMACLLAACSSASPAPTTTTTSAPTTTLVTADCPLTGTPAPGNVVPARPAIVVKVDNYSLGPPPQGARPQSGLQDADVIYEEQVEGAITRYLAVYQCHQSLGLVGPVRSARYLDVAIASSLGDALLVHVGGIPPVINLINASSLLNIDLAQNPQIAVNPPGRYAPYDTYTTTRGVWGLKPNLSVPPSPQFTFSLNPPAGGTPTAAVRLDWSPTSDIFWHWNPATGTWLRSYNDNPGGRVSQVPDRLADGTQNQAQNVVIQQLHLTYGPEVENELGGLEVHANLVGSGRAVVLRNGRAYQATWRKSSLSAPTQYFDRAGNLLALSPGRTWVELYDATKPLSLAASR